MWQFVINTPEKEPKLVELKAGKLALGRASNNDIVIDDDAASRKHAEILFDSATNIVSLIDLNSTNGTYVNRQRIRGACQLSPDDLVRIGQVVMHLNRSMEGKQPGPNFGGTHLYTRELVLESLDEHSIILYDIARKLNTVLDTENTVVAVKEILMRGLGLDQCEIFLGDYLHKLETSEFADPIAKTALRNKSAEVTLKTMYVPIIGGDDVIGLIAMHKSRTGAHPFHKRDLQLAIAISYQTALTMQRMDLMQKVQREEATRRLLLRFVSPTEAEYMLKDYMTSGKLPELTEKTITVMFSDIANSMKLAEHLGTRHFAGILTNFYDASSEIVFKHGGMLKYLGDGVLAIFPQEVDGISPEEHAVLTGRELLTTMNRTGSLDPDRRIIVGVSINTGSAMVGYVGTKGRAEFNVLGDTVNIAFRMQEYARPYKIIVGPGTMAAISTKFKYQRVGAVTLRGRVHTVQAYEILP